MDSERKSIDGMSLIAQRNSSLGEFAPPHPTLGYRLPLLTSEECARMARYLDTEPPDPHLVALRLRLERRYQNRSQHPTPPWYAYPKTANMISPRR